MHIYTHHKCARTQHTPIGSRSTLTYSHTHIHTYTRMCIHNHMTHIYTHNICIHIYIHATRKPQAPIPNPKPQTYRSSTQRVGCPSSQKRKCSRHPKPPLQCSRELSVNVHILSPTPDCTFRAVHALPRTQTLFPAR